MVVSGSASHVLIDWRLSAEHVVEVAPGGKFTWQSVSEAHCMKSEPMAGHDAS